MHCQVCGRDVEPKHVNTFIYECECGTRISALTGGVVAENTTHCKCCYALIDMPLSIDGLGLQCGCLKKVYNAMKQQLKELGFDITFVENSP